MNHLHERIQLLPKDCTILEREVMEFRPFGLDEQGHRIRDLSGMSIKAVVVYLEQSVGSRAGTLSRQPGGRRPVSTCESAHKRSGLSCDAEVSEECLEQLLV